MQLSAQTTAPYTITVATLLPFYPNLPLQSPITTPLIFLPPLLQTHSVLIGSTVNIVHMPSEN